MNTYDILFSAKTEIAELIAMMAQLIATGFEFEVIDDRGGLGVWIVRVVTGASSNVLPKGAWTEVAPVKTGYPMAIRQPDSEQVM